MFPLNMNLIIADVGDTNFCKNKIKHCLSVFLDNVMTKHFASRH